jgi:hypothetical protein
MKKGLRGRFGNYVPPVLEVWGSPRSSTSPQQSDARPLTAGQPLASVGSRADGVGARAVPG